MSKEFTIFVVDCDPTMGESSGGIGSEAGTKNVNTTDLEAGLSYFYNHTTSLLLKNRSSDRIAVVPHGFRTLFKDSQFTYDDLKYFSLKLVLNTSSSGDFMDTIYLALDIFQAKIHLKFVRSLVIITNSQANLAISSRFEEYSSFVKSNLINVIGVNTPLKSEMGMIIQNWGGSFVNTADLANADILKRVNPRATSMDMKFGDDISIPVEIYPAMRKEKIISGHDYTIEGGDPELVTRKTHYYIKEFPDIEDADEDTAQDYTKVNVQLDPAQKISGYRISKLDTLAVDEEMKNLTRLPTDTSFDIIGFIKYAQIPYAYYVGETSYVLPGKDSGAKTLAYNALATVLSDLAGVAIVRYVPGPKKDISVCALIPAKLKIKEKYSHGFILSQLAYKEDEKIGRFPNLSKKETAHVKKEEESEDEIEVEDDLIIKNNDEKEYPTEEDLDLMDQFLNSHDLDKGEVIKREVIDNQKLTLKETQFVQTQPEFLDDTNSNLLPSSPSIFKFTSNLKKIIELSLKKDDLTSFLKEEDFVEKYLVKNESNLFNLKNIFKLNTAAPEDWLLHQNQEIERKLIKSLDVKYVSKEDIKKKKTQKSYTTGEKTVAEKSGFDEFFDINDILG